MEQRGEVLSLGRVLGDIVELIKLKQTLLLLASMLAAYFVAGGFLKPISYTLTVMVLGFISIAAVTAMNMYFDADIDALMERTRSRPLPSGRIRRGVVLILSLAAFLASIVYSAIYVNMYYALSITLGFVFDIFAYTLLLKRRTPLNIVAGAVAGGAPALGGWAAATGRIETPGLLISLIVVAWIPAHIWFLATYYRDDYRRAKIPMLPAASNDPHGVAVGVGIGSLVISYSILGLMLDGVVGVASLVVGLLLAFVIFVDAMKYAASRGEPLLARRMFIRVNIGLGLLFLVMVLEKLIRLLL